jgi:nitrogen PTS system EIIA component
MTEVAIDRQNMPPTDEVLTLGEAATYLKLGERTIHRMIQRAEIPCARVGGQWRFLKSVLDDWLLSRMQVLPRNELAPLLGMADGSVQLSAGIDPRFVVDPILPGSMREVLSQLARPLADNGVVTDLNRFVDLLVQREMLSPTSLGDVAVPHVRRPQDNPVTGPVVVPGICREGVPFGTNDDHPVHFLFLVCTVSEAVHLRLLKRITMLFREQLVRDSLLACDSAGSFLDELRRQEIAHFGGGR